MAYRKCLPCNGTGVLHGTPRLLVEGLGLATDPKKAPLSIRDDDSMTYGLEVKCWQCLGAGKIMESLNKGDTNGGL